MSAHLNSSDCLTIPPAYFARGSNTAPYTVNAVLNCVLSTIAALANVMGFLAIRTTLSRRVPSRNFLANLILTDLGVTVVVQPLFTTFLFAKVQAKIWLQCPCLTASGILGFLLTCLSLLTMMGQAVDRYLALFRHTKYRQIVTTRRVYIALMCVWLLAAFLGFSWLWSGPVYSWLAGLIIATAFPTITFIYIRIYYSLRVGFRANPVQPQAQNGQQATMNMSKYRKTASNMLWIYCVFLLCYSPFVVIDILGRYVQHTETLVCIREYAITIVYLNSLLNPILYTLRFPEIRGRVLNMLRKMSGQRNIDTALSSSHTAQPHS